MTEIIKLDFEGQPFDGLFYKDQPAWPARTVGALLGYARGGERFVEKVRTSDEFVEGVHVVHLAHADAMDLRAVLGAPTETVGAQTLVLLTEAGVFLGALLSRKPQGRRLRAWLAEDVLPALRRGETVSLSEPAAMPAELAHTYCRASAVLLDLSKTEDDAAQRTALREKAKRYMLGLPDRFELGASRPKPRNDNQLELALPGAAA